MSDNYLPMLLAHMQQEMAALRVRVEALEVGMEEVGGQEDEGEPATYMDGSPII